MSSLINRAATKKFILGKLKAKRPHLKFTRVSQEALDKYDAELREKIIKDIDIHPSIGKTFKP